MERLHAAYTFAPAPNRPDLFADTIQRRVPRFTAALSMPVQVQASVCVSEFEDSHRSRVTLDGAVVLAGLSAAFSFGRGAHQNRLEDDRFRRSPMMLISPGEWFTVAAAAAHAPMAAGAPIRIRFHDGDGTRISETYDLGPGSMEPRGFSFSFRVPVAVTVEIATDNLSPASGSTIGGSLVFLRGILARCLFPRQESGRGDDQPLVGTAESVAIPIGQTIRFPEQMLPGATSAQPLRTLLFLDGRGHPLGRFAPRASGGAQGAQLREV